MSRSEPHGAGPCLVVGAGPAGLMAADPHQALRPSACRPAADRARFRAPGGVRWSEIDPDFMLKKRPGVFVAGEDDRL